MTSLERYMIALAKRRAYDSKTGRVNVATLMVLEGDDLPRLTEMFRICCKALLSIRDQGHAAGNEIIHHEAVDMLETATKALLKIEDLAQEASFADWGDVATCYDKTEDFSDIYDERGEEE